MFDETNLDREEVWVVAPSTSMVEIAQLMLENSVNYVVIRDENGLVGIVTSKEIIEMVSFDIDINEVSAEDMMVTNPAKAKINDSLMKVLRVMNVEGAWQVVLTDEEGESIAAVVSFDDIFQLVTSELSQVLTGYQTENLEHFRLTRQMSTSGPTSAVSIFESIIFIPLEIVDNIKNRIRQLAPGYKVGLRSLPILVFISGSISLFYILISKYIYSRLLYNLGTIDLANKSIYDSAFLLTMLAVLLSIFIMDIMGESKDG